MSTRIVDTSFWTDERAEDFSPEDKLFWMYLLTNPHSNLLGIYRVSVKAMAFELGYSTDTVNVLIDRFQNKYGMILYANGEVAIKNYLRYGIRSAGKPMQDALSKALKEVKDKKLIVWVYENVKGREDIIPSIRDFIGEYIASLHMDARVINSISDIYINTNTSINTSTNTNTRIVPRYVDESYHDSLPAAEKPSKKTVKEATHKYGEYGWIKLTDKQYDKLLNDLGKDELDRCIQYIDELAQSSSNKNKWSDWNLVLRRCNREGWGLRENGSSKKSGSAYIDAIKNRYDPIDEWAAAYGGQNQ